MFTAGRRFDYYQCRECGTLQQLALPEDLASHYPPDYYSFNPTRPEAPPSTLRRWMREQRTAYQLDPRWRVGAVINRFAPAYFGYDWNWLRRAGAHLHSRILDVGCGGGKLLSELQVQGFTHLSGVDPYVAADIVESGFVIRRATLDSLDGQFDLVMFHHSLEHTDRPLELLQDAAARLAPEGCVLVRIPIGGTYAWRTYGEHWVQIDAPRHAFLPTKHAMIALAERCGLTCRHVQFDSGRLMLLGSELYRRGLPLYGADGRFMLDDPTLFSEGERQRFEALTDELNAADDGDQACFHFFRKPAAEQASP